MMAHDDSGIPRVASYEAGLHLMRMASSKRAAGPGIPGVSDGVGPTTSVSAYHQRETTGKVSHVSE